MGLGPMSALGRLWRGTSQAHLLEAQGRLLRLFSPHLDAVPLRTTLASGDVINAVEVTLPSSSPSPPSPGHRRTLVLAHGFGSGLGFFGIANLNALAPHFDRIVAVDWLGMGGSSRPGCRRAPRLRESGGGVLGLSFCDSSFTPDDSVRFFIDPMNEFCQRNGLDSFHLLGHSLGGYLAGMFTARYPERVQSLVLASPAGLAATPTTQSAAQSERQPEVPPPVPPVPPAPSAPPAPPAPPAPSSYSSSRRAVVPMEDLPLAMRLVDAMWSSNVTPQQIIRAMGRWRGPGLVRRAVAGRFRGQSWEADRVDAVADYLYHITAQPGSGE